MVGGRAWPSGGLAGVCVCLGGMMAVVWWYIYVGDRHTTRDPHAILSLSPCLIDRSTVSCASSQRIVINPLPNHQIT